MHIIKYYYFFADIASTQGPNNNNNMDFYSSVMKGLLYLLCRGATLFCQARLLRFLCFPTVFHAKVVCLNKKKSEIYFSSKKQSSKWVEDSKKILQCL